VISQIWEATTAIQMKIDPYYQEQNYSTRTKCTFQQCIAYVDISRRSSTSGSTVTHCCRSLTFAPARVSC